jgi:hypothetical protein
MKRVVHCYFTFSYCKQREEKEAIRVMLEILVRELEMYEARKFCFAVRFFEGKK